ncbi:MAG: NAD(+)/NADH kinase [Acidaminococcus sp.]|jgi:NAD+ kinase|nr:NAD(+)/NADH kinase [Acidaminococcus sp.]MCI2099406.1 NAD(+)/NADH kinase [Acidaminococcus sp.]MCI2113766.1 NAD(+)/NADH kinase [Acidaminococcus sp.]MCI2115660.1 NAD(+)/NADH kinase [Acidaminococcus sp.]
MEEVRIGIFPNLQKRLVREILPALAEYCRREHVHIVFPKEIAASYELPAYDQEDIESLKLLDVALTLGGDGTILRAAHYVTPAGIPLIGVNLGKLGFLTEASLPDLKSTLRELRDRQYTIERRSMLQLTLFDKGRIIKKAHALNDMVLESADRSRLTRLKLRIGGEPTANFPSDGLIIATATGSTAYSLSAGGPVVHPCLDATIITPICPHALHARPIVIPMSDNIEVEPYPPFEKIIISADGMTVSGLDEKQKVVIEKCPFDALFARIRPLSYYATWQYRMLRNEGQTII